MYRYLPLLCLSTSVAAQTLPVDAIDDVVVTATRTEQDPRDLALAIASIDKAQLDFIAPVHPSEALNAVAGVNVQRGSGQEHLTAIRSPVLTGGSGAGSFLYLQDGVPLRAAGFANVNGLFEGGTEFARRLEVVRGPGSVLYGSNALHGLVNILSEAPDGTGSARVMASDDGQVAGRLSVSTASTRASINLVHDDGFRDDSGFDQQKVELRHDTVLGGWDVSALLTAQNLNQETAGFLQEGPDAFEDRDLIEINQFPEAFRDARSIRAQVRLDREMELGRLSLTPYARATEIDFLRHFVPGQALEEQEHASIGLLSTLYGEYGRGSWIAGVDLEYTQGSLFEFQENPTRFSFVEGLHYDYDVRAVTASPYAQGTYALGERTELTLGARLDYVDYDYDNNADVATVGRFQRIADRSDDFLFVTPKLGITHDVSDRLTLYGRLARGARAPQTADLYSLQINQDVGDIDVETLDAAEIGAKGDWGPLRFAVAGFAMHKENFYFRNADGFNVSDGETNHTGVEISLAGDLNDYVSLNADLTLARHRYDFTDIVGSPSASITDGDEVDTAPGVLFRIGLAARPTERLALFADLRAVGEYFTDNGNTRKYPGHGVVDARADYRVTDGLTVFANLQNVFDTRYADRADFAFGNDRFFPGRPRHVFFGVMQSFGAPG